MSKPVNILFYYGYPNSFNSTTNQWNNEKVAQDLARYKMIVFGNGLENPSHPDYNNFKIILARLKELNSSISVFGYVTAKQPFADFNTKTSQWDTLGVKGIFIDEAGYDYGITRTQFNQIVDCVHSQTKANVVFANAWDSDNIIGISDTPAFPNSTFNPLLIKSNLIKTDWILFESFAVNTASYTSTGGFVDSASWLIRGKKSYAIQKDFGVHVATVGIINNDNVKGQILSDFAYYSAAMFEFNAWGTSDTYYGASSAQVKRWTVPATYFAAPNISNIAIQSGVNSSIYLKYGDVYRMEIDFTSGSQKAYVVKL